MFMTVYEPSPSLLTILLIRKLFISKYYKNIISKKNINIKKNIISKI